MVDAEALERPADGVSAGVADAGDVAAAEVHQHQRFQDVVDLFGLELQQDAGVAVDLSGVFEVGHAAGAIP